MRALKAFPDAFETTLLVASGGTLRACLRTCNAICLQFYNKSFSSNTSRLFNASNLTLSDTVPFDHKKSIFPESVLQSTLIILDGCNLPILQVFLSVRLYLIALIPFKAFVHGVTLC